MSRSRTAYQEARILVEALESRCLLSADGLDSTLHVQQVAAQVTACEGFLTYDQDTWGDQSSIAAQYMRDHYDLTYASTFGVVEIGAPDPGPSGFTAFFDDSSYVIGYLPQSGTPGQLTGDIVDPAATASGSLGGEALALTLNIDFDAVDDMFDGTLGNHKLGDMLYNAPTGDSTAILNGFSVSTILASANLFLGTVIGGDADLYNQTLHNINENFAFGFDLGFLTCPNTTVPTVSPTIQGVAFHDRAANSALDTGDEHLAGFLVVLEDITHGTFDVARTRTTTLADGTVVEGFYQFANRRQGLADGTYQVTEVPVSSSYKQTLGRSGFQVVISGGAIQSVTDLLNNSAVASPDFGNVLAGSIHGIKYQDVDGNPDTTADDLPIFSPRAGSSFTIKLTGTDLYGAAVNRTAFTTPDSPFTLQDDTGMYTFDNLLPGTYTITEDLSTVPQWSHTAGGATITLGSDESYVAYAGQIPAPVTPDPLRTEVVNAGLAFRNFHLTATDPCSGFLTFTQDDWPFADYLTMHYDQAYAITFGALELGVPGAAGFSMVFDSADAIIGYLPASGTPGALTGDIADPAATASGSLGGEILALTLSVDFDAFDDSFDGTLGNYKLGDMTYKAPAADSTAIFNGMSVRQILAAANLFLGTATGPYTAQLLDQTVFNINFNFAPGIGDNGFLVCPVVEIIVDNLDAGFTTTGKWTESAAIDEYAGSSVTTTQIGATAKWRPNLPRAGTYEVWVWWSGKKAGGGSFDRDSQADYTIHFNGGSATKVVDQDLTPGQWVPMGSYAFAAGTAGYVDLIRNSANGVSTCADAVRFVLTAAATGEIIVDNLDAGFSRTGKWTESAAIDEYAGSSITTTQIGAKATWRPNLPQAGMYGVWVWYSAKKAGGGIFDRDSAARYTVHYNGGTATRTVNQDVNSGQWVWLGDFAFAAGTSGFVDLVRTSNNGVSTCADAVKFVPVAAVPAEVIVDNLGAGFTRTGKWSESAAIDEYAGSSITTTQIGATATWRPTLQAATYQVFVWYSGQKAGGGRYDRDSAADYTIHYSGGTATVTVNQDVNTGQWNLLGTFAFDAGTNGFVSLLRDSANGVSTCADAVRFVPV